MAIYHTSESKSSPPVFGSTKGRPCRSNRIYWQDSVLRHVCVQFCSMICNISGVGSGNRYFMIFWGGGATTTQSWPTSIEFMHAINDAFPPEPNSTCRFITQFASPLHDLFISRPNSPNGQLSVLKDKHVLNEHIIFWSAQKMPRWRIPVGDVNAHQVAMQWNKLFFASDCTTNSFTAPYFSSQLFWHREPMIGPICMCR